MNKRALIIGGSGFIGSHVADLLSEKKYEVTVFDQQPSKWLNGNQKFIEGSILDQELLKKICKGMNYVYNFAAIADINKLISNPSNSININILGNLNVLEACKINNVERFIFASTVYVYSSQGGFYRCSKQAAELYVEEYNRVYGLDYTILRYGSLYGPRSDRTNNIYRIIRQAITENKITYKGDPNAMREYIYVNDAAAVALNVLEKSFANKSIVVTGQEPMKVLDMLKTIAEIMGKNESQIHIINEKQEGHYIRTPYAYKNISGLKYIPPLHMDLGQGLLQMVYELMSEINNSK